MSDLVMRGNIKAFQRNLENAIKASPVDLERALDIMQAIKSLAMSSQILRETGIGRSIGVLRKNNNSHISELAKTIVGKWKQLIETESPSPPQDRSRSLAPSIISIENDSPSNTLAASVSSVRVQRKVVLRQTFTITFGDIAENHVGMQKIGTLAQKGFSIEIMEQAKSWFESKGIVCELVNLHNSLPDALRLPAMQAYVLVARNGLASLLADDEGSDKFFEEQDRLEKDKHFLNKGRVCNKIARHNLCFAEASQEPDYAAGKGRVIAFDRVPLLSNVRDKLGEVLGPCGENLAAEGNYYYKPHECGIGFHGDSERRKVVGVRVGVSTPLHFLWFQNSKPVSSRIVFRLNHGDVYIMSDKATGNDWKKKLVPTLRHAAGASKYLEVK